MLFSGYSAQARQVLPYKMLLNKFRTQSRCVWSVCPGGNNPIGGSDDQPNSAAFARLQLVFDPLSNWCSCWAKLLATTPIPYVYACVNVQQPNRLPFLIQSDTRPIPFWADIAPYAPTPVTGADVDVDRNDHLSSTRAILELPVVEQLSSCLFN